MSIEVGDVIRGAPNKLYIAGEFQDAAGGGTFPTFNPAEDTSVIISSVAGLKVGNVPPPAAS